MKLYTINVNDSCFRADGVSYYTTWGESCEVDGQPMVRMAHGAILPAAGWVATRTEALRLAADKIERLAERLMSQAREVRAQAERQVPSDVT